MSQSEPVIFSTVVEGARKAFEKHLTRDVLARLKAAGMDFEHPQAAYPMATFLRALGVLADAIVPGQPPETQHRKLGREFLRGYEQTAIGFAIIAMSRLVGVKRALGRLGRSLKTTGNYVEAEVREVGPKEMHVIIRVLPEFRGHITKEWEAVAWYRRGVIEGALDTLNVKGTVEPLDTIGGGAEVLFRVAWE